MSNECKECNEIAEALNNAKRERDNFKVEVAELRDASIIAHERYAKATQSIYEEQSALLTKANTEIKRLRECLEDAQTVLNDVANMHKMQDELLVLTASNAAKQITEDLKGGE